MSGRHRQTQASTARRVLVGTVPALGVAGAVTVLSLSEPATAPEAEGAATVPETTAATVPVADQRMPAGGPEATAAVSGAAQAVDRAAGDERARERTYITSVVDDVQADARNRDAEAARKGKERLDAFQDEQRRDRQPEQGTTAPAPSAPTAPDATGDGTCDLNGLPLLGGPTDPDEIVGRDCGLLDPLGHQRSGDPWIDGQLLSNGDAP